MSNNIIVVTVYVILYVEVKSTCDAKLLVMYRVFESCHFAILKPTSSPEPVLQPANSRSLHPGTERATSLFCTERIIDLGLRD
jgi:hypothetical protein